MPLMELMAFKAHAIKTQSFNEALLSEHFEDARVVLNT